MDDMDDARTSDGIVGRQAYSDALAALLVGLPGSAVRECWLVGADFDGWPLDSAAVLQALTRWARPAGRRLTLIGTDFDRIQTRFPRFGAWRRARTHVLEAWQPEAPECADMGSWLLAGQRAVVLVDALHWRAQQLAEPVALRALAEKTSALLHRCQSAWPVTTLGL